MKLPIFLSVFIIFVIFYNIKANLADKKIRKANDEFFEKERKAMFARKKPLDNLNYIKVSLDNLPLLKEDNLESYSFYEKQAFKYQEDAFKYLDKPMLNLTGINNTDLKLEYGSANLNTIIEYEQNYQNLLENLFKWGDSLHKANRIDDAILVLEKGVNIESYLSKNYILLADLYKKTNQKNKLIELKEIVNKKTSDNLLFKKVINHINNLLTEV